MDSVQDTIEALREKSHPRPDLAEIELAINLLDCEELIVRLGEHQQMGRPSLHSRGPMFYAHLVAYILNVSSTNDLIRRLQDDPGLREVCGFESVLPSRPTFTRAFSRMADHVDLIESIQSQVVGEIARRVPGFGEKVAVDSTVVPTNSNPHREPCSDPEASLTAKTKPGPDGDKEWHFGCKLHTVTDANFDIPIGGFVTTAKRNDSPVFPDLLKHVEDLNDWLSPKYVMADKGYDSTENYHAIVDRGAVPVIPMRRTPGNKLREGIYAEDGSPTCIGGKKMVYVRSDSERGHLYQCDEGGCHLKDRKGVLYCQDEHWEDRTHNPRLFPPIPRASREWKRLYKLRQSVERTFRGLKQARRLSSHYFRGLRRVALHCLLSVLSHQVTSLVRLLTGRKGSLTQMVRPVG